MGQRISLEGEKEYKAALREIDGGLQVLKSEMDLTNSAFAGVAGRMEALSATADVLNRQILSQREKVETLRAVLQSSAESYGESDLRTQSWQIKLNRAEAELNKMEGQLGQTENAMKDFDTAQETAAKGGTGLGDVLDSVGGKFGVDLPDGIKQSLNGLASLNTSLLAGVGSFAAIAAAAVKAEKALKGVTDEAAASADDIMTLSLQTGLSAQTIQELRYAAELIDVPFETLQSSMAKMIRSMNSARAGTGDAAEAFSTLGISVTDGAGNLRNSEEVFNQAIDALHNMQNATDRDAVSMAIFGRSAQDLNPLIVQGSDVLNRYRKEAEDTGYVLSDAMLKSLGDVDDAHQRLINTQTEAKNKLALEFAPALEDFYTTATEDWDALSDDMRDSGLVDMMASLLDIITALSPGVQELGDILQGLEPVFDVVSIGLGTIADTLRVTLDLASAVLHDRGRRDGRVDGAAAHGQERPHGDTLFQRRRKLYILFRLRVPRRRDKRL